MGVGRNVWKYEGTTVINVNLVGEREGDRKGKEPKGKGVWEGKERRYKRNKEWDGKRRPARIRK